MFFFLLTLLFLVGASRAAAVARFQTVVLAVQVTVQTAVDIQVGVTAEHTGLIQRGQCQQGGVFFFAHSRQL